MKYIFITLVLIIVAWVLFYPSFQTEKEQAITSPVAEPVLGTTVVPRTNTILYVTDRNGNKDIYMLNLETKEQTALTTDVSDEMNPQLSPDGSTIVYYSNLDGDNEIYSMNLNTLAVTKLTNNNADDYDPSYSTDGTQIVFKSTRDDNQGDIFIMERDGTSQKNSTKKRSDTEEWDPLFASDDSIYFVVRKENNHLLDEIYHMTATGSNVTQMTDNDVPDWYPSLALGGNDLVYISRETPEMKDDIYSKNLTTMKTTRLTKQAGNDADPSFDMSGKKIIFINDVDGDYDIYLMHADGTSIQKILDTDDDELSPIFL